MLQRVDHVGIAVEDLEQALALFRDALGVERVEFDEVPEQGVRVAMLMLPGGGKVELVQPLAPDTPVGRFLARRGPGLHHIAFGVADVRAAMEAVAARGLELVDREPRRGAGGASVAFIHPRSAMGTLIELCQRDAGVASGA